MVTRDIRAFVSRDWGALREAKDAYWAERVDRLGPEEAWRIAGELRRQTLQQHPTWPDPSRRQDDLDFHVRLAQLLRRAGSTRCS